MQTDNIDHDVLIAKYFDNEISPQEQDLLDTWLDISEENKRYFSDLANVWEATRVELQEVADAKRRLKYFNIRLNKQKRAAAYRWIAGSAAAILLCLTIVHLTSPEQLMVVEAKHAKKEIRLPDSSVVYLNANSQLKYPRKFGKERKVYLAGEGYFDVKADALRPFSVHTPNITVNVLGTKFLVTDYRDSPQAETILASGKIDLKITKREKTVTMKPNQKITYDKQSRAITTQLVNAHDYTSWRNDKLVFENVPFEVVAIQLQKWYNVDIGCANNQCARVPVSFVLENEPLDEILDILGQVIDFEWYRTDDGKIVITG